VVLGTTWGYKATKGLTHVAPQTTHVQPFPVRIGGFRGLHTPRAPNSSNLSTRGSDADHITFPKAPTWIASGAQTAFVQRTDIPTTTQPAGRAQEGLSSAAVCQKQTDANPICAKLLKCSHTESRLLAWRGAGVGQAWGEGLGMGKVTARRSHPTKAGNLQLSTIKIIMIHKL